MQVSQFIVETDDVSVPTRNLYYANTFGSVLEETTADVAPGSPSFDPNDDGAISAAVRAFAPRKGGANIAAGLGNLATQFARLTDPSYAPIAVLITDSTATPSAPLAAAVTALKAATRPALGIDVTVVVVGVGAFVDTAELNFIASAGQNGAALVYQIDFFDDIGLSLEEALGNIGAR